MTDHKPNRLVAVIVTALLFLMLCFLIIRATRPPQLPVVNCPQTPRSVVQSSDGHSIDNQLVMMGADQAITDVIGGVPTITLQLLENCTLDYAGQVLELTAPNTADGAFRREDLNSLRVRLYQVTSGATLSEAVAALNQIGEDRNVYTDKNYLTAGMLDAEACGNPNSTGGSPNSTGGSPNSTGGSSGGPGGQPASPQTYANQWAFEHIGLGSILQDSYQAANVAYLGNRIRVGVFDTAPYTLTDVPTGVLSNDDEITFIRPINWVTPEFTLTVNVLPQQAQALATITSGLNISLVRVFTDVSDHGLFVAGMIHAVAPESDIQLYQVLDQHGCGDLYTLLTQLHHFMRQVAADKQNGLLNGAVINLSLGVLRTRASNPITSTGELTLSVKNTASVPAEQLTEVQDNPPEEPVKLLRITLHDANLLNITVVAAAGNDSWRDEYRTQPLGPQLPAAYPFVIGVAGSNANRQRSCFSNWGDVSAPAGDGAPGMVPVVSDTKPISIPSLCAASFETSLIGPVLKSERYPRAYARWNGTSFAAPLVSGLAALVLEAGAQPGGIWMQPDSVARAIKCGASAADGIINVPVTLMRCMGP